MVTIFWISLGVLFFVYVGYPACLVVISRFCGKIECDDSYTPSVSIIIPVYNEEKVIEKKIKNTLSLDYPRDKLEIIVASDGSTDGTSAIVQKYSVDGVTLCDLSREGKFATLNRVVPNAKGDIIVLTDATAIFKNKAIKELTKYFIDENVGVVAGVEKIAGKKDFISSHESIYWKYETKIQECESRIYSTVVVTGPINAMRRELFPMIASNLNLSTDIAIPLHAVRKGKRIVTASGAVALEEASLALRDEWQRKVRISTRAWRALWYHRRLLMPLISPVAFQLIFHKILRWLTLPFVLILFFSNIFVGGVFYNVFLVFQTLLWLLSIIGIMLLWNEIKIPAMLSFFSYFLATISAQTLGLFNAVLNKGRPMWQPARRSR
jgi:biofilm PGA synthesis N-glycosyltransferase PgaC